jgi:RimJ/RimL family protein N-acetyltransferase
MQKSNRTNYLSFSRQYYAEWLDVDPTQFDNPGVAAIPSTKRNVRQAGYSKIFSLYCFMTENSVIISYSPSLENQIPLFFKDLEANPTPYAAKTAIEAIFHKQPSINNKYFFTELPENINTSSASQLSREDFDKYRQFFYTQHNEVERDDVWLNRYFKRIVDRGYCFAVSVDDKLICVTDAPDIPYMSDIIVEPGINTLAGYRKKGFSKIAVGALIKYLLSIKKVPVWSCGSTNTSSMRLAESLGYRKLGVVVSLSL